ncbi:MAG: helix-turn-helix transcriptional regulator [Rhodococcus sp. (in: high G+C Gram-positive bacteria)]
MRGGTVRPLTDIVVCDGVAPHVVASETHHGMGSRSVDQWQLGDGVWLMRAQYRALAVRNPQTRPAARAGRLISMAVLEPGDWSLTVEGLPVEKKSDQPTLVLVDQSRAFDFRGHTSGSAVVVHATHERLTMSIETVHHGIARLGSELPLYSLLANHIRQLGAIAESAENMLPDLTVSTLPLMRSLILSAADASPHPEPSRVLVEAIERYIERNLDDPGLSAGTIAAAHTMSTRQLYKVWPAVNGSLAGFIKRARLERARGALLSDPDVSIATVARRHGFPHATHFTRCFRRTYGVSPSQWRRPETSGRTPVVRAP